MTMIDDIIDRIIKTATRVDTDLVYVHCSDELPDEQVRAMIADPFGWELDEDYLDWESEARWEGAKYSAEEMVRCYDPRDEEEQATIEENWDEIVEGVKDWLMDNDTSNPFAELARQTPDATVMIPLIDEDNAEWGDDRKASQILSVLGTTDETYYNKARDLIDNAPTDLGMAYIVTKVSVEDLVDVYPGSTFTINDPTVVYGSPFTGGVHSEDFIGHRFTAPVESILPDGAWGYTVEEVWGGFPGVNEEPMVWANNRPTTPAPVQEHLDTMYDYTLAISR